MSAWCRWPAAGCGVWAASRHRPASSPIRTSRPLAVVEVTTSGHGKHTCSHIGSPNSYLLFGHFWLCRLVMTSGRQRPDGGCPLKILPTMSRSQPSSARCRIAGRVVNETAKSVLGPNNEYTKSGSKTTTNKSHSFFGRKTAPSSPGRTTTARRPKKISASTWKSRHRESWGRWKMPGGTGKQKKCRCMVIHTTQKSFSAPWRQSMDLQNQDPLHYNQQMDLCWLKIRKA